MSATAVTPTHAQVVDAIETVIHEFVHENQSVHVRTPLGINNGHCRHFASEVRDRLGNPAAVRTQDAFWVHSWLEFDGRHYDAEVPGGVADPHDLPVWDRLSRDELELAGESADILSVDQLHQPSP